MIYETYKKKIAPFCPVAIKLGQTEIHAPEHSTWGVVKCECGETFAIGPHRMYGTRISDQEAAKQLEDILAEDHQRDVAHHDFYPLRG